MRIMVVLPMYGGSLPIGRYCASALQDLGHSVRVFDAPLLYPAYTGVAKIDLAPRRVAALENSFLKFVSQAILSMVEEQEPQMLLALAQAPVDKHLLQRLRQNGIRTVMWFVEDFRLFNYWRFYAPLYDGFAVIQKEPFISELAAIGQKHALYLPLAALPDFHKPENLTPAEKKEYGSDISFMGAGYPNRRIAFKPLASRDFKIWGSDWEDCGILSANVQKGGRRIEAEESVKIYNAAKINLNLHSSINTEKLVSGGDFVNPRTFELAAMGAFQLVDKRSLLHELFAEDELATFGAIDEFYKKIDYFLAHPVERSQYAKRARDRVLREHTYQRRMQTLLGWMENTFDLKNTERANDDQPELAPGLKEKLEQLTVALGLPPNADFEDIVARLRKRSGELDALETAILFLDEWRKQYKR